MELLRVALPGATDEDLYWAYHNFSGAVTLPMGQIGRIDRLSSGLCRSTDLKTAYARTAIFAVGPVSVTGVDFVFIDVIEGYYDFLLDPDHTQVT